MAVGVERAMSRLSGETSSQLVDLYRQFRAGEISRRRMEVEAAAVLADANMKGTQAGDAVMAALTSRALGTVVAPVGLSPNIDQRRLRDAVSKVLDDDPDTVDPDDLDRSVEDRLTRLGRSESNEAFQTGMGQAMEGQPVGGWVRNINAAACPLCVDWADGVVRPSGAIMARHTGCACWPQPVA